MSNPTKQQEIYATKTVTATSNLNKPNSKGFRWSFITYSVLRNNEETIYYTRLFKKQRSFSAEPSRYFFYLKLKPHVA